MKLLLDELSINRSIKRISHEILERNKGCENLVLVGIKTRGEYLAKRIKANILLFENELIPTIALDVKSFRDDLDIRSEKELINYDFKDKIVILVDDVLHKGRTVRAAIEAIMFNGRAKSIQLAVLIDRGHRELPIKPDYVGKNIPTSEQEEIKCMLMECDNQDAVYIKSHL